MLGCHSETDDYKAESHAITDELKAKDSQVNHPVVDSVYQQSFSNQRFKDVSVRNISAHRYLIKGKAQVFEASFSWVVEDGHQQLKEGHEMTDAGAPEWGNFSFEVKVEKANPNSTLHLILFEASPKDGSRQHELPIPLK